MLKNVLITPVGELQTNCYIIYCEATKKCAIIDPGAEPRKIIKKIESLKLIPVYILLTHGHYDHIGAVKELLDEYSGNGIKLGCHEQEVEMVRNSRLNYSVLTGSSIELPEPSLSLREGDAVKVGDTIELSVIHTPGHTRGGSCFRFGNEALFSGDTLFAQSVGRTDLYGGDVEALISGIKDKLFKLPEKIVVLPGHGPHTTIGDEKKYNMYLE